MFEELDALRALDVWGSLVLTSLSPPRKRLFEILLSFVDLAIPSDRHP